MRALPLAPPVKEKLLELKAQQEVYRLKFKRSYNKEWLEYVLVDEMGDLILPDYITAAWVGFLERNSFRKIRFHDLRHTCASLLAASGVPIKQIQLWLGHSNYSTTADVYTHLDYRSQELSANMIEQILG